MRAPPAKPAPGVKCEMNDMMMMTISQKQMIVISDYDVVNGCALDEERWNAVTTFLRKGL
jgi:hypothetical protein